MSYNEVISKLAEKLGVAVEWGEEDFVPAIKDAVERFIKYRITINIVGAVIAFIIFAVACAFLFYARNEYRKMNKTSTTKEGLFFECYDKDMYITDSGRILFFICCCILLSAGLPCVLNTVEAIKWAYIPEVKLLEYLKTII